MANEEHIEILKKGIDVWNQWRQNDSKVKPNLSWADLSDADLSDADFSRADLSRADLSDADFSRADLRSVDLSYADLRSANLGSADLRSADLRSADLLNANLLNANLNRTDLRGADLRGADLRGADLRRGHLRGADLRGADLSDANISAGLNITNLNSADLSDANLSRANLSRANLNSANFSDADLSDANLSDANLNVTDLSDANLSDANLNAADLRFANLNGARLKRLNLLNANLRGATLTGACIEDWHINSTTDLTDVHCDYIYLREHQHERRPHDADTIFAPGEFTQRFQKLMETVDLFFIDGIDWKAFLATFQDLQTQYGDENIAIQGIERKSNSGFEVRLAVTEAIDKALIEREAYQTYETKLQLLETHYRGELKAKDKEIESYRRENINMMEITKLLAGRPINVEASAVANNESKNTNYDLKDSKWGGGFATEGGTQIGGTLNDFSQHIEHHTDEIKTLLNSLKQLAQDFPREHKEEALEYLIDLEEDIQTPEKSKPSRLKASLAALLAVTVSVGGAVATATDFANNVLELSEKLGIPMELTQPSESPAQTPLEIAQETGFIGCVDADADVSTNYKSIIKKAIQGRSHISTEL